MKISFKERIYLFRFLIWFFFANSCLFWLVGLTYLTNILSSKTLFSSSFCSFESWLGKSYVLLFTFVTYIGHFALLSFLPCLLLLPLLLLLNKPRVIIVTATLFWTVCVISLIADTIIFSMFHFHLNFTILSILFNNEYGIIKFLELSTIEVILISFICIFILIIEVILALIIWKQIVIKQKFFLEGKIVVYLLSFLCASYFIFIISIGYNMNIFALQTPNLPLYNKILSIFLPIKNSFSIISRYSETRFAQPLFPIASLHYPLTTLHCHSKKKYNILIIAIDSWRFDALNSILTPNINAFSKQSWYFKNHYSGGNSTQAGLFSLFYGLPSNYWNSMENQKKGAVFIHELLKQSYQIKILFSSYMIPPFYKTIFKELTNLRILPANGNTIPDHDRAITKEFKDFLRKKNNHDPFFVFLFYDSTHGYFQTQNIPKIFATSNDYGQRLLTIKNKQDLLNVINRYKNAIHFVDSEIQKVIDSLKQKKLLEKTIVIITGDHGEEFNDNKKGYMGHASNYTKFQTKTPLIVHWPYKSHQTYHHLSSHYDIVPFLMTRVLDCNNTIYDYSIGEDIFKPHQKSYLLMGSYINMGIVEKEQITTLLTSGDIQITDKKANELPTMLPHITILKKALLEMRKYYRHP